LDPKDHGERLRAAGQVHAHDDLVAVNNLSDEELTAVRGQDDDHQEIKHLRDVALRPHDDIHRHGPRVQRNYLGHADDGAMADTLEIRGCNNFLWGYVEALKSTHCAHDIGSEIPLALALLLCSKPSRHVEAYTT
jgi:hypothetical protein